MRPIASVCFVAALLALLRPAQAQTPAQFYKGKTITLDIGTSVGSGYDIHARLLARHMSKHLPGNPTIVPRNVEGAGGLRVANLLYNTAPKDGTAFAVFFRSTPFEPLFGNKAAQFDATRFTWIGSPSGEVSICASWHASGVATLDDLKSTELLVGSTGAASNTSQYAKVINGVFGTRMRIITGYPGGNEMSLAMERGELGGRCAWSWSSVKATHLSWVEQKRINVFVQLGLTKHPDLPDVPLVIDLARTSEQRDIVKLVFTRQEIAWPYVAPPGVPEDRASALRRAFMETMRDSSFLTEAEAAKLEIMPTTGEDIERLVSELYETPAAIVQKTIAMLK